MRKFFSLALAVSLGVAAAQGAAQGVAAQSKTGVAALPTPDGALLRWYLPGDVLPARGFTLNISGPGGNRTVPIASPQPYSAALGLTKAEYDGLIDTYDQPPKNDNERTQRAFFSLNVVARPAYARALGIMTTLKDLKPGQYTVTVTTQAGAKVGQTTFTTSNTPPVPAPGDLKATSGPAAVQLKWAVPAPSPSNLVVAYRVYRAKGDGPFALLQPSPFFLSSQPGGDVFKDTDLTAKSTYRYQVAAFDLFGRESARTAPVTVTTQAVNVLPAPEGLEASGKERSVSLRWTPIKDERITAQLVTRGTDPGQPFEVVATLKPGVSAYTDITGRAGVSYVYAVVARDAAGQGGARSNLVSARSVNTKPPAAPTGLSIKATETTITLSWQAGREDDLRGYQVYRSETPEAGAREVLLNSAPLDGTTFTDQLSAGLLNRYYYRVTALNTSQAESARSGVVSATLIDKTPPPAPAFLPVRVDTQGVTLSWTQAELPDLAGFRVLRATAGATPQELAKLPKTARDYLDASAETGVTYSYTVQSLDSAGNTSIPSEPVSIRRTPTGTPALPKNIEIKNLGAGKGNRISWTATPGISVVVYRVETAGSPPLQISGLLTPATFTDTEGTPKSKYQLRSVDERGQISSLTPVQEVTTP